MIYFILAFLIVLADQASKYLITLQYSMGGQLDIIPGVLRITYATNTGGAFSMFAEHTLLLSIISAVVCVAIIVLMISLKNSPMLRFSLGMILGGAIGNLIDRFVMGYVVDMFEPLFIDFAVFNVADIFITIGAILFVISVIFFWPKKKPAEETDDEAEEPAGPAPVTFAKPKNAKERRQQRRAAKFGPDIDESTIVIPVDEVKAAALDAEEEAENYEVSDLQETIVLDKPKLSVAPFKTETPEPEEKEETVSFETEKLGFEIPDFSASGSSAGAHEFTLEEIMREYGHDY